MKSDYAGYRLFKAQFRDRSGDKRLSGRWYAEFRDQHETVRRLPLYTSKSASDDAGRMLVRLVADVQVNGRPTDAVVMRWLDGLPDEMRRQLSDAELPGRGRNRATRRGLGLIPAEQAANGKSMEEHLADWRAALAAKGTSAKQIDLALHRARTLVEKCRFHRLGDIAAGRVSLMLSKMREGDADNAAISQRTSNFYAGALGQLCRWAVRERRLRENPLAGLERVTVTDEESRRAYTPEEQACLIAVAENGPERFGMAGADRAMLYRVAIGTGFRATELALLQRSWVNVAGTPPTITLPPAATKNRKPVIQPIAADLARRLKAFLTGKPGSVMVFPTMPRSYDTANMIREDLGAAREAWINEPKLSKKVRDERQRSDFLAEQTTEGLATFHSLRHTFIANMSRAGVPIKLAMDLARHSDPKLTLKRYGKMTLNDLAGAVNSIGAQPARPAARVAASQTPAASAAKSCLAFCLASSDASERISADSGGRRNGTAKHARRSEKQAVSTNSKRNTATRPIGFEPTTCGLGIDLPSDRGSYLTLRTRFADCKSCASLDRVSGVRTRQRGQHRALTALRVAVHSHSASFRSRSRCWSRHASKLVRSMRRAGPFFPFV